MIKFDAAGNPKEVIAGSAAQFGIRAFDLQLADDNWCWCGTIALTVSGTTFGDPTRLTSVSLSLPVSVDLLEQHMTFMYERNHFEDGSDAFATLYDRFYTLEDVPYDLRHFHHVSQLMGDCGIDSTGAVAYADDSGASHIVAKSLHGKPLFAEAKVRTDAFRGTLKDWITDIESLPKRS